MVEYKIVEKVAELSRTEFKDCIITKELNLISFVGGEPVYDVRKWKLNPDGTREMCRGITLNPDEIQNLNRAMAERK